MPARKKTVKAPGEGMTAKQRKRRKPIDEAYMLPIEPLTHNQQVMFDEWDKGKMIYAYGVAGTGKTFVALYKALKDVLNEYTPCLLYTSPSPRDATLSRMPSSA